MAKSAEWNDKKECYIVTIEWNTPRCCGFDMEFVRYTRRDMELWQCSICDDTEVTCAGMYGDDEIEMTEQEYADFEAMERQREKLIERYGTDKPRSIADYWLK